MNLTERITYHLLHSLLWCLSLLPLRAMYVISDAVAWILRRVVCYRLRVVRDNLESSFHEKSKRELRDIERRFYGFLADYFFETVKMLTMSRRQMMRRLTVENIEMVDDAVARGRSVTLLLGHYCNWEWVSSLTMRFTPGTVGAQVYHYLHNKAMDRIFMKIRTRFDSHNLEMNDIMRFLIDHKRRGVPTVTGFIADQCPKYDIHLFVDFLGHDTGVYTGPERIARFLDSEVLFCHMRRDRRGHYVLRFVPVTLEPKREATFDITRAYIDLLEKNIREAPQYWLWSHRRWKRTRADFYEHWGEHADKMLSHL